MQPVEINAGSWYLRALRADDRLSDVSALTDLGVADPLGYTEVVSRGWADDTLFTWAVCIPTTGELIAVIGVRDDDGAATLSGRARTGYDDALSAAVGPVTRFAEGALGLTPPTGLVDVIPSP
ncbi:hypothetical protein AAFP30_19440 [Gordonia sp. CPCC 205515]|uniref:hypothetical protein n=1 Tax=Gordonia sp. CPCC 205515 TaxID=3140791 RepID=UPI003AF3FD17